MATTVNPHDRIVITGVGLTAPNGDALEEFRAALLAGRSGVTRFETRYIGEVLRKELRHADEYEAAYRGWRNDRKPWPLKGPPQPYPKRDELHDRPVLRRR